MTAKEKTVTATTNRNQSRFEPETRQQSSTDPKSLYRKDLKPEYMDGDQLGEYLHCTSRNVALYRKLGLLKFTKLGRTFIYKKEWADEFMEAWIGYDLSSESAVRRSVSIKRWREKNYG